MHCKEKNEVSFGTQFSNLKIFLLYDFLLNAFCYISLNMNVQFSLPKTQAKPNEKPSTTLLIHFHKINITITALMKFSNSSNIISNETIDNVAAALFHNVPPQRLHLVETNLQTAEANKITRAVWNATKLVFLNNNISDERVDGTYNLQALGAIEISVVLQNITTLTIFGLVISKAAADNIASVLQQLELSRFNLQNSNGLMSFGIGNKSDEVIDCITAILTDLSLHENNVKNFVNNMLLQKKAAATDITNCKYESGSNNLSSQTDLTLKERKVNIIIKMYQLLVLEYNYRFRI